MSRSSETLALRGEGFSGMECLLPVSILLALAIVPSSLALEEDEDVSFSRFFFAMRVGAFGRKGSGDDL